MIAALVPLFFGLLIFGLPIFASLAFAVTLTLGIWGTIDPMIVPMRMFSGMNNFSLMSIPYFILAAELMRIGGLSDRLIGLARALIGWLPGGLAAATVLACLFFGSISGSSPDLSPNTPPFFRRVLGYTIGLKRPVFLEPFLWRTHSA